MPSVPLLVASLVWFAGAQTTVPATPLPCREWRDCQQQALQAAAAREYERFHDLAWRAVQTGPPRQPDLMWLLARAQALSGRPHDALVMIQRLAELGVVVDPSGDEFQRTRDLSDWAVVEALLTRRPATDPRAAPAPPIATPTPAAPSRLPPTPTVTAKPAVAPAPAPAPPAAVVPPRPPAPSAATLAAPATPAATVRDARLMPIQPATQIDAAQFAAPRLVAGGLAFDAVSQRFVIGDARERKLFVVGVGGSTPTDMVRAESAGFEDVVAVAIDDARGDLWVAGAGGTVHRLQLVSGRPLRTYRTSPAAGAVRLVDLAIGPAGTVVALDAESNRLLTLGRGATELQATMRLGVSDVTSLVVDDEGTALVTHAGGIVRADLRSHTTAPVTAADGIDLRGIDQLRAHRAALIGLQRHADGAARVVRLDINNSRRVITAATVIDGDGPTLPGRAFLAVSGNDLYYLTTSRQANTQDAASFVVRRLTPR